tara:strand:- start:1025 stop:2587 length:1563 start_codon:yes stop_codon:yes gene_type:complete
VEINKKIQEAIKALQNQDLDKTISICNDILEKSKDNSIVYNICGLALQKKKLFEESIENFKKAIKSDPNNFEAHNNLALSYKYIEKIDLAEKEYLKCLNINSKFVNALVNLAKLKFENKEYKEAIKLLNEALPVTPANRKIFILNQLSHINSTIGNLGEAKKKAEEALKIDQYNIFSIKLLSDFNNHKENVNMIYKMENMINSPNITQQSISILAFQLGKAYEQKGAFDKAYNYFELANRVKNKLTKSILPQLFKMKNDLIKCFDNFEFSKFKKKSLDKKVIFVIGLPRSGTTLVEQIISSHSDVSSLGEIQILKKIIHKNFYKDNELDKKTFLENSLSNINLIQKQFFESLNKINTLDITTDKSIENFFYIGFIKIFFPNSKIILVKRNLKDIFLSIFQTDFSSPFMNWAYDKNAILDYIQLYSDLINFWVKLLPKDLYTIEYEKLIQNSTLEIKSLINFCNIAWDPKCLSHEKNISGIQTASMLQARKPIYKSSLSKFNNYSMYFEDISKSLESKNLT